MKFLAVIYHTLSEAFSKCLWNVTLDPGDSGAILFEGFLNRPVSINHLITIIAAAIWASVPLRLQGQSHLSKGG